MAYMGWSEDEGLTVGSLGVASVQGQDFPSGVIGLSLKKHWDGGWMLGWLVVCLLPELGSKAVDFPWVGVCGWLAVSDL